MNKISQLQIRVSPAEKKAIQKASQKAEVGMSEWVLERLFPKNSKLFHDLVNKLKSEPQRSYVLAEIHDLLNRVSAVEFQEMVTRQPDVSLSCYLENYLAAMVEYAAAQKGVKTPAWTQHIKPLDHPHFGSDLMNLRIYLLTHSPAPFRSRNVFIDSTIGQRV